jgi:hypothetical protein
MKVNGHKIPSRKVQNEKEVKRFLMARAMEIPPMYEDHACSMTMTGEEMLDAGMCEKWTADQIAELDLKKNYAVPATYTRAVNHYKRMLKLANKKGPAAAVKYYDEAIRACFDRPNVQIGNLTPQIDHGRAFQDF